MRRLAILVASLASLALIAAACGGEENRSTAPSTVIGGTTPATTAAPTTGGAATTGGGGATTGGGAAQGDPAAGKEIFTGSTAGCGTCHTLSDAGTSGTIGPNLDDAKPSHELVVDRVTNGMGAMPAFGKNGTLTEQQIQDVAAYVVQATSG